MTDLCDERTEDLSYGQTYYCQKPKGHEPANEHAAASKSHSGDYTWSVHRAAPAPVTMRWSIGILFGWCADCGSLNVGTRWHSPGATL